METNELLADIVFERTAKGVLGCNTSSKELPRKLKSILLVVDGNSPVSKFIPHLTNLLPLSEKFLELENLGYLQRKNTECDLLRKQHIEPSTSAGIDIYKNVVHEQEKNNFAHVLTEMERFLTSKADAQAQPMLSNLKKMTSLDQLKEELPNYFNLLQSLNIDAADHALLLEKLMSNK